MHVAATHTDFPLYAQPRLKRLADSLTGRGDRLTVIEVAGAGGIYSFSQKRTSRQGWQVLFENAEVEDLRPSTISQALFAKLDDLRPDVVLAGGIAFPSGATSVRWCRTRKRGVVIMDAVRALDVPRSRLVNAIKRRIYANVDAMLVPAPGHDASYVWWGIPPHRIFHGLNVVDNEWFARNAEAARKDTGPLPFSCRPQSPFFLGVGRQNPNKNWDCALQAYARYRSEASLPWDLVLVGDGPSRGALEHAVAVRRIEGVHFVGFLTQEALCKYYAAAAALVLPSCRDAWPNVVNEAMACGLPVLVTNAAGCVPTIVKDGENGWSFDPHRPDDLATRMLALSRLEKSQLKAMGDKSREIVSHWGLERFVDGATEAIDACKSVRRGFRSPIDRLILTAWKGRYRPL